MLKKKIGVIGCGVRSDCYLYQLRQSYPDRYQLAGLADPREISLNTFLNCYGKGQEIPVLSSGPELLDAVGDDLDAVIIGSPNAYHLESLIPALKKDLVILLEKPVAITMEDCRTMWREYVQADRPNLLVGFVLRYAPFYNQVKSLLDGGEIGQILSIEGTEMLGPSLSATFMRGGGTWSWRRSEKASGSFLLEKCCHDMDILMYLTGQRISKVSSFASLTRFLPKPEAAMYCRDCSLSESCRYFAPRLAVYQMAPQRIKEIGALLPGKEDDICVFNSEKDIPDHQVLNLEFENKITGTFTVVMDQPKTARMLRVHGTEGYLIGDVRDNKLEVRKHAEDGSPEYVSTSYQIDHDDSGHDGADSVITESFMAAVNGNTQSSLAGLKEGIEACLVVFAAEKARKQNCVVELEDMYASVFEK